MLDRGLSKRTRSRPIDKKGIKLGYDYFLFIFDTVEDYLSIHKREYILKHNHKDLDLLNIGDFSNRFKNFPFEALKFVKKFT